MANTQAMCTSFKVEILGGVHAIGTPPTRANTNKDTFKAALYEATATVNAATTAYNASGEVSGAGYSAGGITVTNATAPTSTGTTAYWTPSASLTYTGVTLTTAFERLEDGLRTRCQPSLKGSECEADCTFALALKLVGLPHLSLHVLGNRLVECGFKIRKLVIDGVSFAFREQGAAIELDQLLLHHATDKVGTIDLVNPVPELSVEAV